MQVKKFEASSVIEALKQVKKEMGPDAIILSTQEAKRSVTGSMRFLVVAAVRDNHLKKKEMAEKAMGKMFTEKVSGQSAQKQKMFIDNVYRGIEKKHEARNRSITQTPYIDIGEEGERDTGETISALPPVAGGVARVKSAAREAFKSSQKSDLFKGHEKQEELMPDHILHAIVEKSKVPKVSLAVERMIQRLRTCGVNPDICERLQAQVQNELGQGVDRKALVDSWFAKWILSQVKVTSFDNSRPVEFFVGPHGSGKTTALVKLATHYVVQEGLSVALVTTDLNKVGTVEQLRVYGRILNVPVFVVRSQQHLATQLKDLEVYDKVLVDTPGVSLSHMDELDFMRFIAQRSGEQNQVVHLVLSALTKESDLSGILKRFRVAQFDDIVVTNVDQTSQHGILINIQSKMSVPFHSFGIGSDVVDGFEKASRERVLDLVFKLTKQIGDRGNDSRI